MIKQLMVNKPRTHYNFFCVTEETIRTSSTFGSSIGVNKLHFLLVFKHNLV